MSHDNSYLEAHNHFPVDAAFGKRIPPTWNVKLAQTNKTRFVKVARVASVLHGRDVMRCETIEKPRKPL